MTGYTYLFVGPPGSGKGTQSEFVAEKLGVSRIDIGAVLRTRAEKKDKLGQKIAAAMQLGRALKEDVIRPIIDPILKKSVKPHGLVIDGYCRTVEQVDHLVDLVKEEILPPVIVIKININESETVKRMERRRYCVKGHGPQFLISDKEDEERCQDCGGRLVKREDDQLKVFKKRLKTYQQKTLPAITKASTIFKTVEVDGHHPIDQVKKSIAVALKPYGIN